jgi:NADH-quinone oxidoreductase subunit M
MSHFGFIALGIFVFTTWSMTGSTLYMLGHCLATAAVFLTAGFLMQRAGGSSAIATYGGVNKVAPVLAGFFLFAVMSAIALPGLASFVGEFLVLLGTFSRYVVVAVIASLGIVLAAAYGLRLYQKVATGPESPHVEGMRDLGGREVTSLVPVVLLTIVLGVFPAPVLNVVNPAVDRVMDSIGMTDPAPALAPAGGEQ